VETSISLEIFLNLLFTFGKIIIIKQDEREPCDPFKLVLPVTGQKTAESGGWLGFAHFPILPTISFNGINGYSLEMAHQFVCDLRITNPHSQLSQLLRNPSQTEKIPDVC